MSSKIYNLVHKFYSEAYKGIGNEADRNYQERHPASRKVQNPSVDSDRQSELRSAANREGVIFNSLFSLLESDVGFTTNGIKMYAKFYSLSDRICLQRNIELY